MSNTNENVLDLDYIKENTIWVLKHESGYRETGKYAEMKEKADKCNDFRDFDICACEGQPENLQPFYKAYEYANYRMGRHDLFIIDDFYAEWSQDPSKFVAKEREVIGKLSDELSKMKMTDDLIINNYNGETSGNHHVGNFVEALEDLGTDFDVVEVHEPSGEKYDYPKIIVQTKDDATFRKFDVMANQNAIKHDRYMGDGKWEKLEAAKDAAKAADAKDASSDTVVFNVRESSVRKQTSKDGKSFYSVAISVPTTVSSNGMAFITCNESAVTKKDDTYSISVPAKSERSVSVMKNGEKSSLKMTMEKLSKAHDARISKNASRGRETDIVTESPENELSNEFD